uniref:Transthyretin-like family-containing protein n=1 Tax=Strongyloides venezuelensis TaxID=75913 RepID=A0A0K0F048_STRVS
MIIFKIFLIFLFISKCEARRFFFILNKYYIGVKGSISCRFPTNDVALLAITVNPRNTYERRPIAHAKVKYGKSFSLLGKIYRITRPKFYLRIVHSCVKSNFMNNMSFVVKTYVEEISSNYIVQNYWSGKFYNRGNIELSRIR